MNQFANELPDFSDLLRAVAAWKGIPAAIVEKDYYLTRALHTIQRAHPGYFVLKGGTSLTKGWGLLERFSEDIDLLLRVKIHGREISKGERERRLKGARDSVSKTPGLSLEGGQSPAETGVHRTAEFKYKSSVEDFSGLSKTVKLEMGTRGGTCPSVFRPTQSIVAEYARDQQLSGLAEDLASHPVEMLDIRRTFVEKLFTIHAAFMANYAENKTRHYYDLYRLCGLEEILNFAGSEEYRAIFKEEKAHSREFFPRAEVPEGDSFCESPALKLTPEDLEKLQRNYRRERQLLFAEPPTLRDIIGRMEQVLPKL
jgi:hypothetical protein